jgi:hypothetical protein
VQPGCVAAGRERASGGFEVRKKRGTGSIAAGGVFGEGAIDYLLERGIESAYI